MKQTGVEWLVKELQEADYIPKDSLILKYVIEQAKEMEKKQQGYSEEEVLDLWNWLNDGFIIRKSLPTREELIGWFEQFKNK